MSTIKILAVAGVSAWMLFGNHGANAQIPVTDGASIAQQVANQIETVAKWKIQNEQIDGMEREYKALTGGRGLGTVLNDPRYREYLPTSHHQPSGA